ncbi:MAG: hypothetical protein WA210_15170 [Burkholderiaceae bacterium]
MPDFEGSTLWRISAFDLLRETAASATHAGLKRQTLLSTTLQAELRLMERRHDGAEPLEAIAACVRLREPALVYLQYQESIWPITLFPAEMLYHSPRSLLLGVQRSMRSVKLVDIEPPGVRPPGHWMHDRIAKSDSYHPLTPALWKLALHGPRARLLAEIDGPAAYRVLRSLGGQNLATPGALGPVAERLRKQAAPLRKMALWPGMNIERASRMLNALYLTSNLIVSRTHPEARPGALEWLLGRWAR